MTSLSEKAIEKEKSDKDNFVIVMHFSEFVVMNEDEFKQYAFGNLIVAMALAPFLLSILCWPL
jgi:hypothetical protein